MKKFTLLASLLVLSGSAGLFAKSPPAGTALAAVKVLPHGDAKRLARIEARDGTPAPERWHILVRDPKSDTGLHEYVVAGGEVVASRGVSQFADGLRAADVIGIDAVRIDSDRAARIAQEYGNANNATIASLQYELKRDGAGASPLWNITCMDEGGRELGRVVITAGKGSVVSHDGFAATPQGGDRLHTQSTPPFPGTDDGGAKKKAGVFERIGGTLQKFFTGRDAATR